MKRIRVLGSSIGDGGQVNNIATGIGVEYGQMRYRQDTKPQAGVGVRGIGKGMSNIGAPLGADFCGP